jgi:hypothetical protein
MIRYWYTLYGFYSLLGCLYSQLVIASQRGPTCEVSLDVIIHLVYRSRYVNEF